MLCLLADNPILELVAEGARRSWDESCGMWDQRRAGDGLHYCCDGGGSVVRVAGDESAPLPLSWRQPGSSLRTFSITFVWVSSGCTSSGRHRVCARLQFWCSDGDSEAARSEGYDTSANRPVKRIWVCDVLHTINSFW